MGIDKSPDAFRTISEVADWLGVQAHVLRFWESKFTQVKPVKRAGGRRYYRPNDMRLLGGIKKLLHDDGLTIKGVQKILREQGVGHVQDFSQGLEESAAVTDGLLVSDTDGLTIDGTLADAVLSDAQPGDDDVEVEIAEAPKDLEEPAQDVEELAFLPDEPALGSVALAEDGAAADDAGTPEPERPEGDAVMVPQFVHRRAGQSPEEPAAATVDAARPDTVDAPDPPPEADIPHTDGALAWLARIDGLTAAQRDEIAPLAAQLRSLANRLTQSASA